MERANTGIRAFRIKLAARLLLIGSIILISGCQQGIPPGGSSSATSAPNQEGVIPTPGILSILPTIGTPEGTLPDLNPILGLAQASTETAGTPTWSVVLPPAFTPQPPSSSTSKGFSPQSMQPLDSSRLQTLVNKLPPAQDFAPLGKSQLPVQSVQIEPQQAFAYDLDHSGNLESLLVYLVHPVYGDPSWDNFPNGRIGLAMFDTQDNLAWSTTSDLPPFLERLSVHARPAQQSLTDPGLLLEENVTLQGSDSNQTGQAILYRWDGNTLSPVWQWATQASSQKGADFQQGYQDQVQLADGNGDSHQEVLVSRQITSRDMTQPEAPINASLTLPGTLTFQWTGQTYTPGAYDSGKQLVPIHPWALIGFAPRVTQAITVDGNTLDWQQLEYFRGPPLEISGGQPALTLGAHVAWDTQNLYVTGQGAPGQTITLAFDSDLMGDFNNTRLDGDNVVLKAAIPSDATCTGVMGVTELNLGAAVRGLQAAAQLSTTPGTCSYEVGIPLSVISLAPRTLVPNPGWVQGSSVPTEQRAYHPNAGQVIGFAVAVDGHGSTPTFQEANPTTWATLVFMADR